MRKFIKWLAITFGIVLFICIFLWCFYLLMPYIDAFFGWLGTHWVEVMLATMLLAIAGYFAAIVVYGD